MRTLKRGVAALALSAISAVGVAAAVPAGGSLADNGVIHGNTVGTHGSVRVLADDGVIMSRD
jgi:hypothetical protein